MSFFDIDILVIFVASVFLTAGEYLPSNKRNNSIISHLKKTKLSIAILLICSVFSFSSLSEGFDLSYYFTDNYKGLNNIKSVIYGFSAIAVMILYCEQKSVLHSKNKIPNVSDTVPSYIFVLAAFGGVLALSSGSLTTLFFGTELLSFCIFYLFNKTKFLCTQPHSIEKTTAKAADFYMLKTAWLTSMGFAAVGISILGLKYGFDFSSLQKFNKSGCDWLSFLAAALLICSFFIKIAAVPFHFWLNKILYTAKNSACCLFACVALPIWIYLTAYVFGFVLPKCIFGIEPVFMIIAFMNILLPALSLNPYSLKQFTFSVLSISTGLCLFLFPGLSFQNPQAVLALLMFFLLPQSLSFAGIYAVLNIISDKSKDEDTFIQGMGKLFPALSFSLLVFILCLIGAPPFITFLSRISMISALQSSGYIISASGIILSMVLMFICAFTIIRILYRETKTEDTESSSVKPDAIVFLCLALLIIFSVFGEILFNFCTESVTGVS